jgi:hypothetical protein
MEPLLNMDMPGEITKTSAIITQRDECSVELTLLFNERIYEDVIFKLEKCRLSEGVFDIEDLKFRTNELADFVLAASKN